MFVPSDNVCVNTYHDLVVYWSSYLVRCIMEHVSATMNGRLHVLALQEGETCLQRSGYIPHCLSHETYRSANTGLTTLRYPRRANTSRSSSGRRASTRRHMFPVSETWQNGDKKEKAGALHQQGCVIAGVPGKDHF